MTTPTIVQLVFIDETGDSYYRMRWPGMQLAHQDSNWRIINLDAKAKERHVWGEEADLLVLYQSNDIDLIPIIKKRKKLGKKTLVEYNDNFYSPPPASPVAKEWSSPLLWQTYERIMDVSDGIIVTGPGLNELFSRRTKNEIYILENHFPRELPPFNEIWSTPLQKFASDESLTEEIRLGWGGSLGHIADFLAVLPTIRELMAEVPQLKFHLMGNDALKDMLQLPPERVVFVPWGSIEDYYKFWRPIHLGIAPLLDTPYNRCRSDIKAIEMSSLGVLPLLQNALPYQTFLHETQQKSFRTFRELKEQVLYYINNPEQMLRETQHCYDFVSMHRIGPRRLERHQLYTQYLPTYFSGFRWKIPLGYHEIRGCSEKQARFQQTLLRAQQLIDSRQASKARALLTDSSSDNPENPELTLAEIKCLAAEKDPSLRNDAGIIEKLENGVKSFPLDLRFRFFQIRCTGDILARLRRWQEIVEILGCECFAFQDFFSNDTITLFCQDLQRGLYNLLPIGEELVRIYSNSAPLRFEMAELYQKQGEDQKSLEHFHWLVNAGRFYARNHAFLASSQLNYLQTWEEALEARQRGF